MSERPVTTDALETLGMIHKKQEARDAIHLAVEPVTAGEVLAPGTGIRIDKGVAWRASTGVMQGIVDPFLPRSAQPGERFWFVMLPRQVRSLRHVWNHPDFPEAA